jgi:hypothetical protein
MSVLQIDRWNVTSTAPDEGSWSAYTLSDDRCEQASSPERELPNATAGARLFAMQLGRGERLLRLRGAPLASVLLRSNSLFGETTGCRLRPTANRIEDEWRLLNQRRGELLCRRAGAGLTPQEIRELQALEQIAERRLLLVAREVLRGLRDLPAPPDDLVTIVPVPQQ